MNPDEFRKKCRGIVPVQFCPYTCSGELDAEGLRENTEFLIEFAEKGGRDVVIMTNGSTTEFYANSIEEQKEVIKIVVETVDGKVPVIAGASHSGTRESIKMAKYIEEVGADCVIVVPPYYHTPTKEGLFRHYESIANSVKIAVMVYNNPAVSGLMIDPELTQRLSKIENIVALKDNSPNAGDYAWKAALIDPDDMVLLNGLGELHYFGSAACGSHYRGFVTYIGNFAPLISYEIYETVSSGKIDRAQEVLRKKVLPIYRLVGKFMKKREDISIIPSVLRTNYMYMSVGKACMDLVGLHGGPLRQPLEDLTEEEKEEVKRTLEEIGVL
ncbi:TPA: dihydrodipicolinate synthase family protein [Candidatus Bathyarchaeota archaeon]|nr:dihydrodipicolinate synthase family protein [Candidatus Bathyarchaeota archaeon]